MIEVSDELIINYINNVSYEIGQLREDQEMDIIVNLLLLAMKRREIPPENVIMVLMKVFSGEMTISKSKPEIVN